MDPDQVRTHQILGKSAGGRPIEWMKLTEGSVPLLLMGGVHGDEPEGFFLVERFAQEKKLWEGLEGRGALWILPRLNPDGCEKKERVNAHGVDLNRNMPTKDWTAEARAPRYSPGPQAGSEPETQILMRAIETLKPRLIISAHSWDPMINYNGPSKFVAEKMARSTQYRISDDIGYPTPGSLGTWAGWERNIATITLEIERDSTEEKIWSTHALALSEAFQFAVETVLENKVLG